MNNVRTYPYYLLLLAFTLKVLVMGTMLTLATHNICLQRLLDDDVNWSKLVFKQRKRNDEPSPNTIVFYHSEGILGTDGNIWLRRLLVVPVISFFRQLADICISKYPPFLRSVLHYTPDKIFIKHCSLIR